MSQPNYAGRRVNVRAIIYQHGKLLAVKHIGSDGETSPYYAVAGGGVDPHESLEDGLKREMIEELGVMPVIGKLLFIQQFRSRREGYDEELEFFFAINNPEDFDNLDLTTTSHGSIELAVCEYVDPHAVTIYPTFLHTIELDEYFSTAKPVLVVDNFNE
ncbi:MAG: NUDIX domain-containing protein [Candidatus Saccharimonas sp.]